MVDITTARKYDWVVAPAVEVTDPNDLTGDGLNVTPNVWNTIHNNADIDLDLAFDSIMAARWRDAVKEMKTPAEDGSWDVARPVILNDLSCRLFQKTPTQDERCRFQDRILIQSPATDFINTVQIAWTCDDAATGDIEWGIFVKPVNTDGTFGAFGSFLQPSPLPTYSGTAKYFITDIPLAASYPVGQLLIIDITRDYDGTGDDLAADVGLVAARLV